MPIMLLKNIDPEHGLCNGTCLLITRLRPRVIEGRITNGSHCGQRAFILRITLTPSDVDYPFTLKRRQFPVRIAFAMTINKAQGQTLKRMGLYLPQPVFGHGQLYVALSRVGAQEAVKVVVLNVKDQQGEMIPDSNKVHTRNVVYTKIL